MNQELIEHMKSQLNELELDYRDGAWERFLEKKNRHRKLLFWRRATAAAAVLFFMLLLIPGRLNRQGTKQIVLHPPGTVADRQHTATIIAVTPTVNSRHSYSGKAKSPMAGRKPISIFTALTIAGPQTEDPEVRAGDISGQQEIPVQAIEAKPKEKKKPSFEELLAAESAQNQPLPKRSDNRKWTFALSIGQALDTRSKTDLSLGTHIAYALSDRLSLSSGLLYNQLGGAKTIPLPEPSVRNGKMLNGSQANLAGIDIPLDLQIKAGKQLYARVGVSAYAVLSQRQTLNYSENKMVVTSYVDPSGTTHTETVTTTEVSTESVPEEKLKQHNLIGLYNLSVGYQQKITRQHTLSFEPYLKIPINGYSEQKLNLVQGGLRIKVDF